MLLWQKFKYKQFLIGLISLSLFLVVYGCGKQTATVDNQAQKEFDIKVYQNNDFLITPQQLKGMLGSDNLVLLDCNKPDLYAS